MGSKQGKAGYKEYLALVLIIPHPGCDENKTETIKKKSFRFKYNLDHTLSSHH